MSRAAQVAQAIYGWRANTSNPEAAAFVRGAEWGIAEEQARCIAALGNMAAYSKGWTGSDQDTFAVPLRYAISHLRE